ncbi:hypothetical protein BDZ94DRAFT_456593 [Collybia nuda]|uniref:TEA domain-containing protein n=1 Tax=Collybia nuda TaxID=64659 RepID=A0A9P6CJT8_9AGAR|nr:hypothetical protein BDZ94DRAFT_456593 [Collybia nuda]
MSFSPNTETANKSDPGSSKSLTPQRKHRKLLKDGSGTEVWPESIEKIFVQGLREYWDSPWATYSQSRGRSRWRNQFLVDYLQKMGINRTKKQVASHIQVLRNMWKGEPEFYLVAGGEELYENGTPVPVKAEDRCDTSNLIPFDFDGDEGSSSASTSPNFSPLDSNANFSTSPQLPTGLYELDVTSVIPRPESPSPSLRSRDMTVPPNTHPSPQFPFSQPLPLQQHTRKRSPPLKVEYPSEAYASSPNATSTDPNNVSYNKATAICLMADGMTPFTIKLDALIPLQEFPSTALALKIKIGITPVDDIRSPSTLHGFIGSICLAQVWASTGKCVTRVYADNLCISEEIGSLDITNVEVGTAVALLPESTLSRCRWLDAVASTTITQEIVVDGDALIYVIYELDRRTGGALPSAELVGYQKYKTANKAATSGPRPQPTTSTPRSHPPSSTLSPFYTASQTTLYSRRPAQPSISCALTPVNNMRHLVSTPISF